MGVHDISDIVHDLSSDHDRTEQGFFSFDAIRRDLQILCLEIGRSVIHGSVPAEAMKSGIAEARWDGRLDIVGRRPFVILACPL